MNSESHHPNELLGGRLGFSATLYIAAGIFLGLGALRFVWLFGTALAVLVLGITIAEALSPIVDWAQRHVSRTLAVVAIYFILTCVAGVFAWLAIPAISGQMQQFLAILPQQLGKITSQWDQWLSQMGAGNVNASDWLAMVPPQLVSLPMGIMKAALTGVLLVFLSLYWLLAKPAIVRYVRSLAPNEVRPRWDTITSDIGRAMGGYLRGVALNGLAVGVLTWIALRIAGVHLSFVLGFITGLGEFFPYIGPILSAVPAVLVALVQSQSKAVLTLLIFVGVHQIEGHLLTPNIMRSQTDIPRPLVIIALFAGGIVGGLLGAMVAIPAAGAAKVYVDEVFAPALRRRWAARGSKGPL